MPLPSLPTKQWNLGDKTRFGSFQPVKQLEGSSVEGVGVAEVSLERNKLGEGDEFILKMQEVGKMKRQLRMSLKFMN